MIDRPVDIVASSAEDGGKLPNERRVTELDGLRGFAIAAVLLFHLVGLRLPADGSIASELLRRFTLPGWAGVDLFFVLSGFLITGILLRQRRSDGYFSVFYLRRICRIFPLYYLLLLLFYLLVWWQPPAAGVLLREPEQVDWAYFVFLQNFSMAEAGNFEPHWLGVSWSLAIEEQFYIILPLAIWLLPVRGLPLLFALAIIVAPLLRWQLGPGLDAYVNSFARVDAMAAGGLLACWVAKPTSLPWLRRQHWAIGCLCMTILVTALLVVWQGYRYGGVWNHSMLALAAAASILLALAWGEHWLTAPLRMRWLVWLGWHSYGIYLLHIPVFGLLIGWQPEWPALFAGLLSLPVTLLLAALSFHYLERPIITWSHRRRYRRV